MKTIDVEKLSMTPDEWTKATKHAGKVVKHIRIKRGDLATGTHYLEIKFTDGSQATYCAERATITEL